MAMTTLDNDSTLATIFVPTTVQPAVMSVVAVLGSRPTKKPPSDSIAFIDISFHGSRSVTLT
jgi:hypothetical protein